MENYQDYYADLDLEYPDQQQHWTVQKRPRARPKRSECRSKAVLEV